MRRYTRPTRSRRPKRAFAAAAIGLLALSLMPGVAAADTVRFGEVCDGAGVSSFLDRGTTHARAIDCLNAYTDDFGDPIIRGFDTSRFGTTQPIRRDAFATLVFRFARVADPSLAVLPTGGFVNPFVDVDPDSTHGRSILALAELGLVQSRDGTYRPQEGLTRSQAASVLHAVHVLLEVNLPEPVETSFTDLGEVFGKQIEVLTTLGVISGETPTRFGYANPIQRGQVASLLARSAQVLLDQGLWSASLEQPTTIRGVVRDSTVTGSSFAAANADTVTLFRDGGFQDLRLSTDATVTSNGVVVSQRELIDLIGLGDALTCTDISAGAAREDLTCAAVGLAPGTIEGRLSGSRSVDGVLASIYVRVGDRLFADIDVTSAALGAESVTYTVDGVTTANNGPLAVALQVRPSTDVVRVSLVKDGGRFAWAFTTH
jgi:hypothetical protein